MIGNNSQSLIKIKAIQINQRQLLIFLIVLLLFVISAFLISKSLSIRFQGYQEYRNAIVQLREQESTFNQEILKSRYELFTSYDPLVQNLAAQKVIQQQLLQTIPDFIETKGKQEIQRILEERGILLAQKESLSERFKSQNALLKNSWRYLPLLATQLEEKLELQDQKRVLFPDEIFSLRSTLNDLIRNVLLYNAAEDDKLKSNIETLTRKLSQLQEEYQLTSDEFPSQLVISHANIILTQKPQVEELKTQLLLPLDRYTKELEKKVESYYQQSIQTVNQYRLLTYSWFFSLLIFLNYFLLNYLRQNSPDFYDYKKNIKKITNILTEIFRETENLSQVDRTSELLDLVARKDEIGKLAQEIQQTAEQVKFQNNQLNQQILKLKTELETVNTKPKINLNQHNKDNTIDESFSFLTARLILLTKNRRKLLNPMMFNQLETVCDDTLNQWSCQLFEFQGESEQIQLQFSYPVQVQLSQLVTDLKTVSSASLSQEFQYVLGNITDASQIWSDAYFITSCEGKFHQVVR